ncbi:MAG: DUF3352 domain-containing protein [Calothrix sp. C42_A2020_038]|nr:DUF3352 domain-containing protein [Calothrix sp. C42_A2020_038]
MRKLIQIGMVATVAGALLCIPSVNTKSVIAATPRQVKPIQTNSATKRMLALRNKIAFLEKNLSLAGTKQTHQEPKLIDSITSSSAEIADFFPANTPILAFISTKAETWASLSRFHLFKMVQQGISQLMPEGANTNFDYVRDVQSWLGDEIGIGFLPKVANQNATMESNFVILAPIRDSGRLQSLIDVVQKDKQRVKVKKYNDATIYEINTSPDTKQPATSLKNKSIPIPIPNKTAPDVLVLASWNGYVALGFNAKPIELLIDTKSANAATIGQKPEFQEFTRRQRGNRALYSMYQNLSEYIVLLNDLIKDITKDLPSSNQSESLPNLSLLKPENLKQYNSIYSSVTQQPEGLRFQIQTFLNPKTEDQLKSAKPEQTIVSRMPGATYTALTGSNISLQWQALTTILSASIPEFDNGLKGFRAFVKSFTGLDFDKEIIGWMDGEYGLFLYPTKGGFFNIISPNFNLGIGLVIKTTNRSLAENTLNKFGELIKTTTKGEVVVKNSEIKGQALTSWDAPNDSSKSLLAYSWIDQDTLIVTSGFGAMADLVPKPKAPLASTYNFSNATSSLPYPNQGYFYVNTGSFLSWVYGFVPQDFHANEYFKVFKQAAGSIHSLSATTSKINQGEQFDFLVTLAPAR